MLCMQRSNEETSESNSESITRRRLLMEAGAGGTALAFSGVASARRGRRNRSRGRPQDTPASYRSRRHTRRPPEGPNSSRDSGIIPENIHSKDPEEVFDDDILNMSEEELDNQIQDIAGEGMADGPVMAQSVDRNCIIKTVFGDDLPAIDLDLCFVDEDCAVELIAGAFGQSISRQLTTCPLGYCQVVSFNALSDMLDITTCALYEDIYDIDVEYCNWRPGRGWRCTTYNDVIHI